MDPLPTHLIGLLAAAILVALIARRLHLPYTVGLVAAGAALAATHLQSGALLTHDLIYQVLLPPLLFEAALFIPVTRLRQEIWPLLALSTLGVMIAAATVATGLVWLLQWQAAPALVFGVLIAATDPVSVIALFKDLGLTGRLRFLVETESLLNDGVAAVLFAVVLGWALQTGNGVAPLAIAQAFLLTACGGAAIGLACGYAANLVANRTADRLVETALTLVAAYGAFTVADQLGASGVLATVCAGLVMGNLGIMRQQGEASLSSAGREAVIAFWEVAAFLVNSLVFLLIGLAVQGEKLGRLGWAPAVVILALVLLGRVLTVYPICAAFARSRLAVPLRHQHVLVWGGLRGALALALALALPPALPRHDDILVATFGVVVFSVVVQGLTMRPLLRRLRVK